MPRNIPSKDVRTFGIVLRRTNVGEADRIINLITPQGKMSVIAKGVRREKSKLAGGIEMFTLSDYSIHFGKSDIGVLTGVKMLEHYSEIIKDFNKIELAGLFLKKISIIAEQSDSKEYYEIIKQSMVGLNSNLDIRMIEAWFLLNIVRASGEEINLYRDKNGEKLREKVRYSWNVADNSFARNNDGDFGTDEIKTLRLIVTSRLKAVNQIKIDRERYTKILGLARIISRI